MVVRCPCNQSILVLKIRGELAALNNALRRERSRATISSKQGDVPRVDGQLALARAFGDKSLKNHMSAKPDMEDILVDLSCEFLILGSNGLWKVIANEEAVELVKNTVDPAEAAQALVRKARERLTDDDISCIVILFREL